MSETFQDLAEIPKDFFHDGMAFVNRCTKRTSLNLPTQSLPAAERSARNIPAATQPEVPRQLQCRRTTSYPPQLSSTKSQLKKRAHSLTSFLRNSRQARIP